jgi:hypothetical protein
MTRTTRWKTFLAAVLLLSVPAAVWAYVDCTDVVTVYPNGYTTQCKDCQIYSNVDGSWQGEITNCLSTTRGGSV